MNSVIIFLILSALVAIGLSYPYSDKEGHIRVRRLQPRVGYSGADKYPRSRHGVTAEQRGEIRNADFKVLRDVYEQTGQVYGGFRPDSSRVGSRVNGGW